MLKSISRIVLVKEVELGLELDRYRKSIQNDPIEDSRMRKGVYVTQYITMGCSSAVCRKKDEKEN